jgi:hypothetical protein
VAIAGPRGAEKPMKTKLMIMIIALVGVVLLSGCSMTGSAIQGVGGVFNKTGGTIKNLGK